MGESKHLDDWPEIGFVLKAHGVRGQLSVQLFNQHSDCLDVASCLKIGDSLFQIKHSKRNQKAYIVDLVEVDDRNAAEELKGKPVKLSREDLDLDDGELLLSDLIGLNAYDTEGRPLGVVDGIEAGVQDRLVVVDGNTEFQVPLVDELVPEIDFEKSRIVFDLPEGMPTTQRDS